MKFTRREDEGWTEFFWCVRFRWGTKNAKFIRGAYMLKRIDAYVG